MLGVETQLTLYEQGSKCSSTLQKDITFMFEKRVERRAEEVLPISPCTFPFHFPLGTKVLPEPLIAVSDD